MGNDLKKCNVILKDAVLFIFFLQINDENFEFHRFEIQIS